LISDHTLQGLQVELLVRNEDDTQYVRPVPEQHKIIFNHNVILNGVRLNQDYTIKHSDLKEIESKFEEMQQNII
jgi:hypothetical protein